MCPCDWVCVTVTARDPNSVSVWLLQLGAENPCAAVCLEVMGHLWLWPRVAVWDRTCGGVSACTHDQMSSRSSGAHVTGVCGWEHVCV